MDTELDTPGQPPGAAAGTSRGVLLAGRVRDGARHVLPHGGGGSQAVLHRGVALLAHTPHSRRRERRKPQAHRSVQSQHHRHQPGRGAAIRLRQLHGQRAAARQRPDAHGAAAGRRQPLHARLDVGRRPAPQRLRIAGPAATGHRVLRRKTVRGVPRRTADRAADG